MKPDFVEDIIEKPPEISKSNERRTANWDIRNAPKNYLVLVLSQFGSAFFAFASVWLITKYLGSEGYGGVVAIIAASQVAQIFVNWTSYSVVRFGTEEFIENEHIARVFWCRLFIFLPSILLIVLVADFWFPPLAGWLKLSAGSFWLVILHFIGSALWIHVQFSLQSVKLPRVQGFLMMFERLLIFGGIVILLGFAQLTTFSTLLCYAAVPFLMVLVGMFYLRKFIFARFSVDLKFFRKIVAYSLPLLPFSLVGYFSGSYIDAIFVSKFLSISDLGVYSVATQINGIALQFPTLANSLLLPLFITLQKESANERTQNYFRNILPSLTLLWGIACSLISFICFFAIPLVFGKEFTDAAVPLWILLSASVVSFPVAIGYSALSNSTSTTYISMFAAIFSALANIAANFWLIPKYGMAGCAWATLIAYAVSVLTFAALLRRSIKTPLSWTFWAILPILAGAIVLTFNQNPFWAVVVCLIASFLVAYLFGSSIGKTFSFLKNFGKHNDSIKNDA